MSAPVYEELGLRCPRCHKRMFVERDHDGADQECLSCDYAEAGAPRTWSWTPAEIRRRIALARQKIYDTAAGRPIPIVYTDDPWVEPFDEDWPTPEPPPPAPLGPPLALFDLLADAGLAVSRDR